MTGAEKLTKMLEETNENKSSLSAAMIISLNRYAKIVESKYCNRVQIPKGLTKKVDQAMYLSDKIEECTGLKDCVKNLDRTMPIDLIKTLVRLADKDPELTKVLGGIAHLAADSFAQVYSDRERDYTYELQKKLK